MPHIRGPCIARSNLALLATFATFAIPAAFGSPVMLLITATFAIIATLALTSSGLPVAAEVQMDGS